MRIGLVAPPVADTQTDKENGISYRVQIGRRIISSSSINRIGIDIYAEWDGMSDADKRAQVTGFSVEHGHVGYALLFQVD
jgi:hypothetical protein